MIRIRGRRGGDGNVKKPRFPSNAKNEGLKWHTLLRGLLLPDASTHTEVSYSYKAAGMSPIFTKGFKLRADCSPTANAVLCCCVAHQLCPCTVSCGEVASIHNAPVCILVYGFLATMLKKNSNKIKKKLLRDIGLSPPKRCR